MDRIAKRNRQTADRAKHLARLYGTEPGSYKFFATVADIMLHTVRQMPPEDRRRARMYARWISLIIKATSV